MAEMTRDELRELRARALCLDESPDQIGSRGSCEGGCIHPAAGSVCPYLSGAEATMKAEDAAGLAVVPKKITDEMEDSWWDAHDAIGEFWGQFVAGDTTNAANHAGNLLREK